MTGRIPEEKIQEIRDRIDIVEVVSSYLQLKRSGANHMGLCPFHGEKTPSFNVNAPRQIFHCFGCGVGGNVFSFLMRIEGLSFPEAVRRLGEQVGVEVAEEALTPAEEKLRQEQQRLIRINEVACDFYHRILLEDPAGAAARRYLRKRGYDGDDARKFRLGYAPDAWEALAAHLKGKGFDPHWAKERLGLIRAGKQGRGDYDLFRRRLLFPIHNVRGEVVAFGGRVLDESLPKYINSPESPVYHKGRTLYGLYRAKDAMRRGGEGIVVEGYFDQMALVRAGFDHAVATCGTALTPDHGRLLKRYAGRLLLLFDQDRAGRMATFRTMEVLLPAGISVAVVDLEPGEDPDSFLRQRGESEFRKRLESARPVLEVFIEAMLAEHGESVEGRTRAVEEVMTRLRLLPSDIERRLYLKALAQKTGIEEDLLQRKMAAPRRREPAGRSVPAPRPAPRKAAEPSEDFKEQDWLLHLMLIDSGVRRRGRDEGVADYFFEPDRKAIAEAILALAAETEEIDETLLETRLNEPQKAILSGILIRDEAAFAEAPEQVFEGCRRAGEKRRLKQRLKELDEQIRQAEQQNDLQRQKICLEERIAITQQLKRL